MNKQQIFTSALDDLVTAARKVNESWPQDDYSSKDYPFSHSYDEVVRDIEIWRDAEQEILDAPWQDAVIEAYKNIKPSLFGWEYMNTGGHCMVSYKDYECKDGVKRMISMNDESASLIDVTVAVSNTEEWYDNHDQCEEELVGVDGLYDYYPTIETFSEFRKWLTDDQIQDVISGLLIHIAQ